MNRAWMMLAALTLTVCAAPANASGDSFLGSWKLDAPPAEHQVRTITLRPDHTFDMTTIGGLGVHGASHGKWSVLKTGQLELIYPIPREITPGQDDFNFSVSSDGKVLTIKNVFGPYPAMKLKRI